MLHGVVTGHELVPVHADAVALPPGVAEGQAREGDVAVGVGADKSEADVEEVLLVAAGADLVAAGVGVAGEELDDEGGHLKEAVDEGAADDAAPVAGDESDEGSVPLGLGVVPVPVSGPSGDAEVD